jgi:hypothetical protein
MLCRARVMLRPCDFSRPRHSAAWAWNSPPRDGTWTTCPLSVSSGYYAEFHEGCYQKHTNPLICRTSSSDISGYHTDFHEGHGTVGEWQGRGMTAWFILKTVISKSTEPTKHMMCSCSYIWEDFNQFICITPKSYVISSFRREVDGNCAFWVITQGVIPQQISVLTKIYNMTFTVCRGVAQCGPAEKSKYPHVVETNRLSSFAH